MFAHIKLYSEPMEPKKIAVRLVYVKNPASCRVFNNVKLFVLPVHRITSIFSLKFSLLPKAFGMVRI